MISILYLFLLLSCRQDITDALKRIGPRQSLSGTVSFGGWSRMALPISKISIDEVKSDENVFVCILVLVAMF